MIMIPSSLYTVYTHTHTHTGYVYIYYQSTDRHTGKKTEKEHTY